MEAIIISRYPKHLEIFNDWDVLEPLGRGQCLIKHALTSAILQILYNVAAGSCILVCAGALPGYWTSVALIDIVGRKPIQLMGFVCLTVLFIAWGFDYNNLKPHGHLAIYVIVQYFFNFGKLVSIPFL
jgi:hypothetical protein